MLCIGHWGDGFIIPALRGSVVILTSRDEESIRSFQWWDEASRCYRIVICYCWGFPSFCDQHTLLWHISIPTSAYSVTHMASTHGHSGLVSASISAVRALQYGRQKLPIHRVCAPHVYLTCFWSSCIFRLSCFFVPCSKTEAFHFPWYTPVEQWGH